MSNRTCAGFSLVEWNMTTSRQYLAQLRAYSGLLSKVIDQPGALVLGAVAQERLEPVGRGGPARRGRSKCGGRYSTSVVKVAGSTLGLFLVRYWAISGRAPPKSGSAA